MGVSGWLSSLGLGRRSSALAAVRLLLVGALLGCAFTLCLHSLVLSSLRPPSSRPSPPPDLPSTCPPQTSPTLSPSPLRDEDHGLLLIGVMTAQKYVDSRAVAIWKTWAPLVPGKLVFFVAEDTVALDPELPVVRLPGTDDSYPPQKKSFMMLDWMAREGLGRFEWFMRADDDVYVRTDKLEILLRSLNSSRELMLGQAGLGTAEEFGTLSLGAEDNYCMGGPGMVFSAATLAHVAPHLPFCLRNMYTGHEDVEVGRCVRKFVGVSCSWSYEMQSVFYNNQSGLASFSGDLNVGEVNDAVTLHPLKLPHLMLRLHGHLRRQKTADLRFRAVQLSRDVRASAQAQLELGRDLGEGSFRQASHLGLEPSLRRFRPQTAAQLLRYDFLSPNILFCADDVNCPRHNAHSYLRYAVRDVTRQLLHILNRRQRQLSRQMLYQETLYGYVRVDPLHGVDYVLDLLLLYKKFKGRRVTVPVRRHSYVTQSFGPMEQRDSRAQGRLDLPLTMVVPLKGRWAAFSRFLDHFDELCLRPRMEGSSRGGPTRLLVVLFLGSEEDGAILEGLRSLRQRYAGLGDSEAVRWVEVSGTEFSRGLALAKGAEILPPAALMFFTDADVLFSSAALERVRLNTEVGRRAYFPIVFSEFAPQSWEGLGRRSAEGRRREGADERDWDLGPTRGFFRHFGFGIVALHKADLDAVGGMATEISGWGLEDVNLFEKFLASGLEAMRAADPGLLHVYHAVLCQPHLPPAQYEMCLNSEVSNFASSHYLVRQMRLSDPARPNRSQPVDPRAETLRRGPA